MKYINFFERGLKSQVKIAKHDLCLCVRCVKIVGEGFGKRIREGPKHDNVQPLQYVEF